jgi:hypothetical protein
MNKAISILIGLLLVLIAIIVGSFVVALYPYEPLRVDKFIVDKDVAKRGEKVCFQFEGEKYYDVYTEATVELVNGEAFHIMSYSLNMTKGTDFKQRCFMIPASICPSGYRIRWTGSFDINPLNHPKRVFYSDLIEVK